MGLIDKAIRIKYKQEESKLKDEHKKDPTAQYWKVFDKMLNLSKPMGKVSKQEVLQHVREWAEK
jgi:hypothetical protein